MVAAELVPLSNFDFSLLDSPDFKEDSVREDIVMPLLSALGYSSAGPDTIIRSRALLHPFVTIGAKRRPIRAGGPLKPFFGLSGDVLRRKLDG
jgi:hypothetical protein